MWRLLGSGLGPGAQYTQLEHGARSFAGMLPQLEHGARSFEASLARCTQFCNTVHASRVRCTQLFAGSERRATSSTCAFDASRSFRGLRNCVHRIPAACSVTAKLRAPYLYCVNHAPEACARPQKPTHSLPCLSRPQPMPPPCVSTQREPKPKFPNRSLECCLHNWSQPGQQLYSVSSSSSQRALAASLGMQRPPRGLTPTLPTAGPSGRQLRLNCCAKKRR